MRRPLNRNVVIIGNKPLVRYLLAVFWVIFFDSFNRVIVVFPPYRYWKARRLVQIFKDVFGYPFRQESYWYSSYFNESAFIINISEENHRKRKSNGKDREIIRIGRKETLNYQFAIFWSLYGEKIQEIELRAAGKQIIRARKLASVFNEKLGVDYEVTDTMWKGNKAIHILLSRSELLEKDIIEEAFIEEGGVEKVLRKEKDEKGIEGDLPFVDVTTSHPSSITPSEPSVPKTMKLITSRFKEIVEISEQDQKVWLSKSYVTVKDEPVEVTIECDEERTRRAISEVNVEFPNGTSVLHFKRETQHEITPLKVVDSGKYIVNIVLSEGKEIHKKILFARMKKVKVLKIPTYCTSERRKCLCTIVKPIQQTCYTIEVNESTSLNLSEENNYSIDLLPYLNFGKNKLVLKGNEQIIESRTLSYIPYHRILDKDKFQSGDLLVKIQVDPNYDVIIADGVAIAKEQDIIILRLNEPLQLGKFNLPYVVKSQDYENEFIEEITVLPHLQVTIPLEGVQSTVGKEIKIRVIIEADCSISLSNDAFSYDARLGYLRGRLEHPGDHILVVSVTSQTDSTLTNSVEIPIQIKKPIEIIIPQRTFSAYYPISLNFSFDLELVKNPILLLNGKIWRTELPRSKHDSLELKIPPGSHVLQVYDTENSDYVDEERITVKRFAGIGFLSDGYNLLSEDPIVLKVKTDPFSKWKDFNFELNSVIFRKEEEEIQVGVKTIEKSITEENTYFIILEKDDFQSPVTGTYELIRESLPEGLSLYKRKKSATIVNVSELIIPDMKFFNRPFSLRFEPENPLGFAADILLIRIVKIEPEFDVWEMENISRLNQIDALLENTYGRGNFRVDLIWKPSNEIISSHFFSFLGIHLHPNRVAVNEIVTIQIIGDSTKMKLYFDDKEVQISGIRGLKHSQGAFSTAGEHFVTLEVNGIQISRKKVLVGSDLVENSKIKPIKRILNEILKKPPESYPEISSSVFQGPRVIIISPLSKLYLAPVFKYAQFLLEKSLKVGQIYYMIPRTIYSPCETLNDAIFKKSILGFQPLLILNNSNVYDPRVFACPYCEKPLEKKILGKRIIMVCECSNLSDHFKFTIQEIMDEPPEVLMVSADFINGFFEAENTSKLLTYISMLPVPDVRRCGICGAIGTNFILKKLGIELDDFSTALEKTRTEFHAEIEALKVFKQNKNLSKQYKRQRKKLIRKIQECKEDLKSLQIRYTSRQDRESKFKGLFKEIYLFLRRIFLREDNQWLLVEERIKDTKKKLKKLKNELTTLDEAKPIRYLDFNFDEFWKNVCKSLMKGIPAPLNQEIIPELDKLGLWIGTVLITPDELKILVNDNLELISGYQCSCGGEWLEYFPPSSIIVDLDLRFDDPPCRIATKDEMLTILSKLKREFPKTEVIALSP